MPPRPVRTPGDGPPSAAAPPAAVARTRIAIRHKRRIVPPRLVSATTPVTPVRVHGPRRRSCSYLRGGPLAAACSYSRRAMAGSGRDERAAVRGAQEGSLADFETLFRRHWPAAYRAAYLVV